MNDPTIAADPNMARRIADNWQAVLDDVQQAARAAGRDRADIQIVGVTKYVGVEATAALLAAGCHQLGESRPQQLWQKAEAAELGASVHWHLIGHLQTNKVRRTLQYRPTIHSVDSSRLLRAIDTEAAARQIEVPVLLEVNVSGDASKTGLPADVLEPMLAEHRRGRESGAAGAQLRGLMAMAGWGSSAPEARRQFAQLRQLRDHLQRQTGIAFPELSMGMSGDFVEAIAEGATLVRIGSRLFAGVGSVGR